MQSEASTKHTPIHPPKHPTHQHLHPRATTSLHHLQPPPNIPHGILTRLSHLQRDPMSHLLPRLLPVQNVRILQQESLTYLRRRARPRWKGVGGGANGVVGRGAGDVGQVVVGGGIVEVDGVEGGGGNEAAVDKVFDCGDRGVGRGAMEPGGGLGGGLLEEGFGSVEERGCHGVRLFCG